MTTPSPCRAGSGSSSGKAEPENPSALAMKAKADRKKNKRRTKLSRADTTNIQIDFSVAFVVELQPAPYTCPPSFFTSLNPMRVQIVHC